MLLDDEDDPQTVAEPSTATVTCETAVSYLEAEVDRPGVKLTEVQAIDGGYDAMAHGLQGGESWLVARERGVWTIASFSYNA